MVADIRIKTSFLNHRKRRKLKLLLGVDATGCVLDLWINAAMNNPDGVLRGMDHEDIALDAGWDGDSRQFCEALIAVGFIDHQPGCEMTLHDWAEHQAWVVNAPARVARARKGSDARWRSGQNEPGVEGLGPEQAKPEQKKMPEVGRISSKTMLQACDKLALSMLQGCSEHPTSIQQAMPLSSPSPLKGNNTPPERAIALSTPQGGQRQSAKRFVPPSVEEIAAYCAERGNGIDAQAVHDHYTANGWKVGKNHMRDWRAAVRTWETKRRQEQHTRAAEQSPAARLLAEANGGTQQ